MANSGTITSPEWPLPYPNHQNCTWKIACNETVQIKITYFEIGPNLTASQSLLSSPSIYFNL